MIPKINKRKEIIKRRVEINEIENKKRKIKETNGRFFEENK